MSVLSLAMVALLAGAVAAIGGLIGTLLARALARRTGFVSAPNPLIPQHTRPVAYLGGLGVAIGVAVGLVTLALLGREVPLVWMLPAALFLALGIIDDRVVLKPATKFLLQALAAMIAVGLGVRATLTGVAAVDAALSWLWLITLVNAFNLTDVCDGLLASIGVVLFGALAFLDPTHAGIALVAAGACLGFLALNFPPASIFLGDAGSHLLGFLAGVLTLAAAAGATQPLHALAGGGLIAGVPLFELLFLTTVRVRKGLPWWRGSPDHFSLRLQAAGLTRRWTDLIAAGFTAIWAACGLAVSQAGTVAAAVLLALVALSAFGAAAYLLRHEVELPPRSLGKPPPSSDRVGVHAVPPEASTRAR